MAGSETGTIQIARVRTPGQAEAVRILAYEFVDWLRGRYPEMTVEIDTYLRHQKFEEDMRDVRARYVPPGGECLLAVMDGAPVGILMLKDSGGGVCEMNRMYVRDAARGHGAGRALVQRLVERAREMGFASMTLSALPRHHEALSLYRSVGFAEDDRTRDAGNAANVVLMRLDLEGGAHAALRR